MKVGLGIHLYNCVIALCFACSPLLAKDIVKVSGTVRDAKTEETLIGASVMNKQSGVVTNSSGFYTFFVEKGEMELICNYIGYNPQTYRVYIQNDTLINFNLETASTISASQVYAKSNAGFRSRFAGSLEVPQKLIQSVPATFGEADVIKTLQLMPGIQSGTEGTSGIFVRGGGEDENLIMLDGVPIYNTNHLFGIFSSFSPDIVKKVTLYTGAMPARFGGRASSIIDVRTKDGNSSNIRGSITLGLLNDRFHIEGPLYKNGPKFFISGRSLHSFLFEPAIKIFSNNGGSNIWFYDFNAKITQEIGKKDRLSFTFYNGWDKMRNNTQKTQKIESEEKIKLTNVQTGDLSYGNKVASVKWQHFSERLFSDVRISWNAYNMNLETRERDTYESKDSTSTFRKGYKYDTGIRDISLNTDIEYRLDNDSRIYAGGEFVNHFFRPQTGISKNGSEYFSFNKNKAVVGNEFSIYGEYEMSLQEKLILDAGLRANFFFVKDKIHSSLCPRLSLKYDIDEDWMLKLSYSRSNQNLHLLTSGSLNYFSSLWVPVTDKIPPENSDIFSFGIYRSFKGFELSVEPYYKKLNNVIDYVNGMVVFAALSDWEDNVGLGNGRAYGIDFLIRKNYGKTRGFLSYSLSKSERIFPGTSINNGKWFPFQFDRRHTINLNLEYKLTDKIEFSALWQFKSGQMITVEEGSLFYINESARDIPLRIITTYLGSKNNYRLSPTHRLDLSVSFRKPKKHGERIWSVGIYNVLNSSNPQLSSIKYKNNKAYLSQLTFLPIMPTISYTYNFR